MRVSTMGMYTQSLSLALSAQSKYSEALTQESSGIKSSSLSEVDGNAGTVISLKSDIEKSEKLASQAEAATSELEVAYSTLSSISDLIEDMRTTVASAIDGTTTDTTSVESAAEDALDSLTSLLNTTYADNYVFSGTQTSTAPVDTSDTDYDPLSGSADTDYYQATTCTRCIMIDSDTSIEYGVTADDESIEQVLRALSELASLSSSTDSSATLSDAYDLLGDATTGVGLLQEKISGQTDTLEALVTAQESFQDYAEEALSDITEVDVAVATTNATQLQTILSASYSALGDITTLSILDYI